VVGVQAGRSRRGNGSLGAVAATVNGAVSAAGRRCVVLLHRLSLRRRLLARPIAEPLRALLADRSALRQLALPLELRLTLGDLRLSHGVLIRPLEVVRRVGVPLAVAMVHPIVLRRVVPPLAVVPRES